MPLRSAPQRLETHVFRHTEVARHLPYEDCNGRAARRLGLALPPVSGHGLSGELNFLGL